MEPGFYNLDCMEAMREFPDGFFDLAIVDPPYGGITPGGYMKNNTGGRGAAPPRQYNMSLWTQESPSNEYFKELFRVSNNQVIWGGELLSNQDQYGFSMLAYMGQRERFKQIC